MADWIRNILIIAVVIWPLIQVERWIHDHIQGLGMLWTDNGQVATFIYYIALLPGVVLHEASQWLLAQALRVKVKKFRIWPEQKRGGKIRLGLVDIDRRKTDIVRQTLIGVIPLVTGMFVISFIGNARFEPEVLTAALATGDPAEIVPGVREFLSAPDFWLWFYLLFAIANAMLPEEHDKINWWIFLGAMAAVSAVLLVLDLSILLEAWLEGPFTRLTGMASFALVAALTIDLFMMGVLSLLEAISSRILQREVDYG